MEKEVFLERTFDSTFANLRSQNHIIAPNKNAVYDIAIVIVNYNVEALLRRCLQTVFESRGNLSCRVIVVDNNSKDGSVQMVRNEFPQVDVIANKDNPGYSAGNNQGLRELNVLTGETARYCLLLNPDTELMPNTLCDAIQYMDANYDVGVLGPKLLLPDGNLDIACRRSFPTPEIAFYRMLGLGKLFPKSKRFGRYNLSYLDDNQLAEVDSVVGAFMLIRTEAILNVGLLDERFWMYGEDLDWAKRIKDSGYKVIYNPDILALHVKRASSRQNKKADKEFYRAMLIFYYKHYRPTTPKILHYLVMFGILIKGGPTLWRDVNEGYTILRQPA